MRSLLLLTVAAALAVSACTTANTGITASGPSASDVIAVDRDFDLKPGQTARVDGTAITVSFVGVPEDSRCPVDVQCVWAGNGAVSLVVTDETGAKSTVILNTTLSTRSASVFGYEFYFTGVNLEPKKVAPI